MEDLPFEKPSQVRTDASNTLILATSMFLSNEGASKVLSLLGAQVSNDTIQRLYDQIEFIDNPDVEEIRKKQQLIRDMQDYWNGQAGKTPDKKAAENSATDGKKIYFHGTGGYRQPETGAILAPARL